MIKIGITGQSGFIGSHLYNSLGFKKTSLKEFYLKKNILKMKKI